MTRPLPFAVALVCAAAGPQAFGSLCPPGLAEEEASPCRALHHQRYGRNSVCSVISLSALPDLNTHRSPSASKSRGISAAWQHHRVMQHSMGRMAWSRPPSRSRSSVQSPFGEYSFQQEVTIASTFR